MKLSKIIVVIILTTYLLKSTNEIKPSEEDVYFEIKNTQILYELYQKKLALLKEYYQQAYNQSYDPSHQQMNQRFIKKQHQEEKAKVTKLLLYKEGFIDKHQDKYLFYERFNGKVEFLGPNYYIYENAVYEFDESNEYNKEKNEENKLFQFIGIDMNMVGNVLVIESNKITSILAQNSKVSIVDMKKVDGQMLKEQYLLGTTAEPWLASKWHHSYNMNEYEDILIQYLSNKIYLINKKKDSKYLLELNATDQIVDIYSLNQYKIFVFLRHAYLILNIRSRSVLEYVPLTAVLHPNQNATNQQSTNHRQDPTTQAFTENEGQPNLIGSCQYENAIYGVLDNGCMVRYVGDKMVHYQLLPSHLMQKYSLTRPDSSHKKYFMKVLPPYLFFASSLSTTLSVFNSTYGTFTYWIDISIDQEELETNSNQEDSHQALEQEYQFEFFKRAEQFNLILSTNDRSYYLQLTLPERQDFLGNSYLMKIISVLIALGVFFYFKKYHNFKKQPIQHIDRSNPIIKNKTKNQKEGFAMQKMMRTDDEVESFLKKVNEDEDAGRSEKEIEKEIERFLKNEEKAKMKKKQ